ncbi:DUF397 domain-containing protein [Streptomyces sp. CA-111067]|jgi:hypothetical protein|uniref:DUF397 domain-containing protein n=1 Tax=Streptomyces sp. CA-111067 TaxID=3240046 RepID=UPI003D967832
MNELKWRKSSYSNHEGACVELAVIDQWTIGFRDSKDPSGPILAFDRAEAAAFLSGTALGEFTDRR